MFKKRAFTLVELLVVISIIALLLSVLMPSLNKARESGRRIVCANHMKTIGIASQIYVNSWDGKFVPIIDLSVPKPSGVQGSFTYYCWMANTSFRNYVALNGRKTAKYNDNYELDTILPKEFYCPSDEVAKKKDISSKGVLVSFGCNLTDWQDDMGSFDWHRPTNSPLKYAGYKSTEIKRPSERLAFVDAVDWYVYWSGAEYANVWDKYGQVNPDDYSAVGIDGPTVYRHSEGTNILFYDGHVSYMKKGKVFVKKNPNYPARLTSDATGMWSNN